MIYSGHKDFSLVQFVLNRVKFYSEVTKFRLSLLVVFSSIMAFLFERVQYRWLDLVMLFIGGFLVTGASIAINQILEKETDKLMKRTSGRPLPSGDLSVMEVTIFAGLSGLIGIGLLSYYFNPLSGLLASLSLLTYAFLYTPFKRISPAAVFIGAVPGALPLLIGSTAAVGSITSGGFVLFIIQLLWQMPHFWAIAWVMDDDYRKGGFTLLPSGSGKSRSAAFQILTYNAFLLLVSVVPFLLGLTGYYSLIVVLISGLLFLYTAIQLCIDLSDKSAKKLMFASFFYIPIVQIALVIDKI
ncbi:MAG: heme o synthase [Chitinophagales bacterium]|nr:heme o synthase [Chitinophagales bacterium]